MEVGEATRRVCEGRMEGRRSKGNRCNEVRVLEWGNKTRRRMVHEGDRGARKRRHTETDREVR